MVEPVLVVDTVGSHGAEHQDRQGGESAVLVRDGPDVVVASEAGEYVATPHLLQTEDGGRRGGVSCEGSCEAVEHVVSAVVAVVVVVVGSAAAGFEGFFLGGGVGF